MSDAVGVTVPDWLGVVLLLSETEPVLEALAPTVSDDVGDTVTVEELLTVAVSVVEGVAVGVLVALLVSVPEGVPVRVGLGVALLLSEMEPWAVLEALAPVIDAAGEGEGK